MRRTAFTLFCALYLVLISSLSFAITPKIIGTLNTINNNIIVNISMTNIKELESIIKSGIEKEIDFTIELIRVWKFWPDEFVVSKKISKKIKYDNLRDQYWASSFDGVNLIKKKFKDYNSMRNWIFRVNAVNLANIRELDPANYYIRIIVESKSLEQLPVMGLLMHLVPEVDMSLAKESQPFYIGDNR